MPGTSAILDSTWGGHCWKYVLWSVFSLVQTLVCVSQLMSHSKFWKLTGHPQCHHHLQHCWHFNHSGLLLQWFVKIFAIVFLTILLPIYLLFFLVDIVSCCISMVDFSWIFEKPDPSLIWNWLDDWLDDSRLLQAALDLKVVKLMLTVPLHCLLVCYLWKFTDALWSIGDTQKTEND